MFANDLTVFPEKVNGAVVEVFAIPITDAVDPDPVALAPVVKLRTVFPVIVFVPADVTMPIAIRLVLAAEGTYAVFRFAILLFVIAIVALLLLLIPVTDCTLAFVDAELAFILFAVLAISLPITLLLTVTVVPPPIEMPTNP